MSNQITAPITIIRNAITAPVTLGIVTEVSTSWDQLEGKPITFPPETHTHPATGISDSGTCGRDVLRAETPSAALTELGAGTAGARLFDAATEIAVHTILGRRVFHLDETQTVDTAAGAIFPGLSAITLKPNTHYAVSGWYRSETINASFDFEITGATNPTFDFDATEVNHRSSIFVSSQTGALDTYNVQSVINFRITHSGITTASRKSRSLFYGFFLTTSAATTLSVRLRNRAATGTVAIRDGVIIIEEVY